MSADARDILLVYDEHCPVCDAYARNARIRESLGRLRLVSAREHSPIMDEIARQGLDIDQGMVLKMDDALYYGADAIHVLSLISSRSGALNRINYWILRSATRARMLYPVLRACRNALLKALRKTKVNNLGLPDNDRF